MVQDGWDADKSTMILVEAIGHKLVEVWLFPWGGWVAKKHVSEYLLILV